MFQILSLAVVSDNYELEEIIQNNFTVNVYLIL